MRICHLILVLLLSGSTQATTLTVCHNGCEYSSIQAAIDASRSGDTIEVHSGTYLENVKLNKQLKLLGVNTKGMKPTIDASYYDSPISISTDGVHIEGFNVTHSCNSWSCAGINGETNISVIRDVTATKNHDGIQLSHSNYNTIEDNYVFNNTQEGIALDYSESNVIKNNEVYNQSNSAIDLGSNCTSNVVENNSIHDNDWGVAEGAESCYDNVIRNNYYHNNEDNETCYYVTWSWG